MDYAEEDQHLYYLTDANTNVTMEGGRDHMRKATPLALVVIGMLFFAFSNHAFAYLQPVHSRFLQRDPEGYVDGMDSFQYVASNSLSHLDPSGSRTVRVEFRTHDPVEFRDGGESTAVLGRVWPRSVDAKVLAKGERNGPSWTGKDHFCSHAIMNIEVRLIDPPNQMCPFTVLLDWNMFIEVEKEATTASSPVALAVRAEGYVVYKEHDIQRLVSTLVPLKSVNYTRYYRGSGVYSEDGGYSYETKIGNTWQRLFSITAAGVVDFRDGSNYKRGKYYALVWAGVSVKPL